MRTRLAGAHPPRGADHVRGVHGGRALRRRDGFFARGAARAGPGRDFVTSPEVGPLFGRLVARALDGSWERWASPTRSSSSRPAPAGVASAADVLRAAPACAPALRYVLVERSAALRGPRSASCLALEPADEALGPFMSGARPGRRPRAGRRRRADRRRSSTSSRPCAITGVVLANELLDNLPVRIVERAAERMERGAGRRRRRRRGSGFVEVLVAASAGARGGGRRGRRRADVPSGARLPVPGALADWLEQAARLVRRGDVILVDYGATAAELLAARARRDGCAPTGATNAAAIAARRAGRAATSPATCPLEYLVAVAGRAGFDVAEDATPGRVARRARHRRPGRRRCRDVAGAGPPAATSRRSRAAAACTRPRRSPTRPVSAHTGSWSCAGADFAGAATARAARSAPLG